MSGRGSPSRPRLPSGDPRPLITLVLLSPLVEPSLPLVPGRMDRRLADPLDADEPLLEGLAEPFMVSAIKGRGDFPLAVDGRGGGAIVMRLLDAGGMIDLRVEGVLVREGVEELDEALGPVCLVTDVPEFCTSFIRTPAPPQYVGCNSQLNGRLSLQEWGCSHSCSVFLLWQGP